jgi:N utilization substance protein B
VNNPAGDKRPRKGKKIERGNRRLSRILALSLLFQHEDSGQEPFKTVELFKSSFDPKNDSESPLEITEESFDEAFPLARELFLGTVDKLPILDKGISGAAINWSLERMGKVDRAIIRLAYYEMLFRDDIPPKVSLNEAIEIAKSFGIPESRGFVNGILDKLHKALPQNPVAQNIVPQNPVLQNPVLQNPVPQIPVSLAAEDRAQDGGPIVRRRAAKGEPQTETRAESRPESRGPKAEEPPTKSDESP